MKLRLCPFCGSENIDPKGWGGQTTDGPACDDCGGSAGSTFKTLEENIEMWQRRAVDPLITLGETFLNKCMSAWAAGEPEHRVNDMLNAADAFRAALDKRAAEDV